jgi:hypothetical protein
MGPDRVNVRAVPWAAIALLLLIVVAIFQLFLRYQYVAGDDTKWRVDRVTGQVCRVRGERLACDLRHQPNGDATASLSP